MNIRGFVNPAQDNVRNNPISLSYTQLYDYASFGTTVAANSSQSFFQTIRNLPGRAYVPSSGQLIDTQTFTIVSVGIKPYFNDQTQATALDLSVLGNTELTIVKNATNTVFRALTSSLIFPGAAVSSATTDLPQFGNSSWESVLQLPEAMQIVLQQGDSFDVLIKNSEALTLSAATEIQVVLTGLLAQYAS